MKQHITVEQFKELPVKIRKKLVGHSETGNLQFELWEKRESHYLQLTIGKMIEILEKETTSIDINRSFTSEEIWTLIIGFGMGGVEFFEKELCDALWKAVKEVL